jgi:hypothetical protein
MRYGIIGLFAVFADIAFFWQICKYPPTAANFGLYSPLQKTAGSRTCAVPSTETTQASKLVDLVACCIRPTD